MAIQTYQCRRLQFVPGDRLLVTVPRGMNERQIDQVRRAVTKWAGDQVPLLVVQDDIKVEVQPADQRQTVWTP